MNKQIELKLDQIPRELKLMLEWIQLENHPSQESYDTIDWELFLQLSIHHRLYPLLYTKMKDCERIPEQVRLTLEDLYKHNTFQMLHLSAEMEKLSKLLLKSNIPSLFLKGPVLSADLYGDISKRTSGDLDILIPINDLQRAEHLLVELGYKKDEYIQSLLNDWKWRHHHFTYYHPIRRIKVEIHWRLNPAPSKEPSFQELWSRRRKSSITNFPVYMLGLEDLFFFLVTHGSRHGWSRLRWLMDIHQLIHKELDWSRVFKRLKKYQARHIGGQSLILANQLLRSTLTKEMQPLIIGNRSSKIAQETIFYLEQMVNLHNDPVPKEVAKYHAMHLFSLMSFQQKILYLLSTLHPYYTDVETLPLPNKLHFLYFPLRPLLWFWRKTKKQEIS
ncbi:nucleotidyltransferase domain-containing protein [Bacillus niameyensis]|uniref:nucleotidyltransferase domain-containing protein n=1 Tax=Bacillus niameyensis TaxID=1522308 RepID=UPI00078033A1|nr:nucleotidyltransferase family protein [Bacillus niameyensis]